MIEIQNLTKTFGRQKSLDDVSLRFQNDEKVIIMGQNGAGKTTLVRTVLGEYIPTKGTVSIKGYNPFKKRQQALQSIGFVPQLPPPIKFSVNELMRYAQISSGADVREIISLCNRMDLDITQHRKKLFFKLSGGMKQKLLIAIAMAKKPDVFIFDEPTANLDPKGREKFYALLNDFDDERLMIFISHRLEEVGHIITRKIQMDLGKVTLDETV